MADSDLIELISSLHPAARDYLVAVLAEFRDARPELLRPSAGRWNGPLVIAGAPAGLWWYRGPLRVCAFPWDAADGSRWLHVSVSAADRDPTYAELSEVRARLFRPTDVVLHVWPPAEEHFNLHSHCLHLWARLDGERPIPDLRGDGGGG